tara:strand:+ start:427 stop:657 length:231 start_codon:yes stop_codon:yes gene_type:complete
MKTKELKKTVKEETSDMPVATLEEKRLLAIKEEINNTKLLDEYVHIYMNMVLSHASRLRINFDSIKELLEKELKEQ